MIDEAGDNLVERAKELECMYAVDDILQNRQLALPDIMRELLDTIPLGFTHPDAARVRISLRNEVYEKPDYPEAEQLYVSPIVVEKEIAGAIAIGYVRRLQDTPADLLSNEVKLLDTICNRISLVVLNSERELHLMMDMLHCADPDMLLHIGLNMERHLRKIMGDKADQWFDSLGLARMNAMGEINSPTATQDVVEAISQCRFLIQRAAAMLPVDTVFQLMAEWTSEHRIFTLVKMVDSKDASVADILDAVDNYSDAIGKARRQSSQLEQWLLAELTHRFLTSDEQQINLMLDNLRLEDFKPVLQQIISSTNSKGSIGGKGAGLFIASQILKNAGAGDPLLEDIKTPRTWYMATDQLVDFLHYNGLEEMNSYKYNSAVDQRASYDGIAARIKKSRLPPHTVQMLRVVLEDFSETPIIVRSSSLLEDRQSGAFSGKYKSLFLHNQGTRQERLDALIDAILEIYASMYNPDALQYRRERAMLNAIEQMGMLIQEVVGRRIGKYYLPAFAGVAFSHNLLRWSSRITRDGGLVRIVPGLGTRAVDRVNDDYPVIFSPGQPELQINQTPADIYHYSPKFIDVINMETGCFETRELKPFLKEVGTEFPDLHRYVSVYADSFIQSKSAMLLDPQNDDIVMTFQPMITSGAMPQKLKRMLDVLSDRFGGPVDIEFAHDSEHLYLLQCRPHNTGLREGPAPIPQDLNPQDVVFTAKRFVSDGLLENITHIVYVDADAYGALSTLEDLLAVGTAVGLLNAALPRRRFILMGPGRWGSRGDVKLGVRVTYSDISGTAALIEVAKERHSYVPELSFGTHFFQDLVESGIVYLPLYPDQKDVVFKESFFRYTPNMLPKILPQYARLADVIRVFDIPDSNNGRTLSLHMNSELEQAVAFLSDGAVSSAAKSGRTEPARPESEPKQQDYWQWRNYMAEQIAANLDAETYGVKGVYLFGSTNTGTAGMGSDIDLLIHFDGSDEQRRGLEMWLDGWSGALAKINYLQTGYDQERLLDVHIVTDADIAAGDPFAAKIHSPVDPASPLPLRSRE